MQTRAGTIAPPWPPSGSEAKYVGRSIPRPEDIPLVRGEAEFIGDINRPDQLHARIVRSTVAHGLIREIHTAEAARHPGVVAVVTAADLPDVRIPIRMQLGDVTAQEKTTQPPLARERVRYVGEPIAVIVARSQASAEDASAVLWADVDPLRVVMDTDSGIEADASVLHDALGSNVVDRFRWRKGDVDALFQQADIIISERLSTQRHTAVPLETRGLLAEFDSVTQRLIVWGASKVKHFNRGALATMLELPEDSINLVECEVGGGFGVRGELYPEDFLVPWLAMTLMRPVKWIEDRIEHLVATNHSREQDHVLEIAAASDGTLLAFRDRARNDMGAYVRTHGAIVPVAGGSMLPGPYAWGGFLMEHDLVLTNKTPTGTYRGPGGVEAAFARERLLDRLAAELGISPVDLRLANLIRREQFPFPIEYDEGHGSYTHDTGDYVHLYQTMLERADAPELGREVERRRAGGELVGVGTAAFVEAAVIGPWEDAQVFAEDDGRFRVAMGVSSMGQGLRTALGQLAADALGVPFGDIVIDYHSTDSTPFGFGTFASRVTTVGGNAMVVAIRDLQKKLCAAAADHFGISSDEVTVEGGTARAPDGSEVTAAQLGSVGTGRFVKEGLSVGFGSALAVVAVEAETGVLTIERLIVATELGNPVNPKLVHGQIVGAAAQGVGGALLEAFSYDGDGQPLATTLGDYLMPTATDVPEIEVVTVRVEVPNNPLSLGPAGENGIYGVAPAIANAVAAAIGDGPGVCTSLPLTPEKVWRTVRRVRAS